MATSVSVSTTYTGEFAGKYIASALLSATTLEQGLVEIKPNVKFKEVIKKMSINDIVKNATCDFDATSSVALTERILQPESFQVNLQLCKADFRNDWEAISMGYSAFDNLPASFSDFMIAHVAAKVAQKTEQTIWSGVNANAGEFDGFTTLFAADADVIDVTGTTIDSSNVVEELGKVLDAVPSALYGREDLMIYIPQNVARAYMRALGTANYKFESFVGEKPLDFEGVRLAMVNGLASNKIVAAQSSNLFFGCGLMSDNQEVRLIDMSEIDGSQNVRVVMRYTAGVQYGLGSEVVYYRA
jgi:hypothetical protein